MGNGIWLLAHPDLKGGGSRLEPAKTCFARSLNHNDSHYVLWEEEVNTEVHMYISSCIQIHRLLHDSLLFEKGYSTPLEEIRRNRKGGPRKVQALWNHSLNSAGVLTGMSLQVD